MEYTIWGIIVLALLVVLHVVMRWLHYRQLTMDIRTIFDDQQIQFDLTFHVKAPYDWIIETGDRIFLCKLFHIGKNESLVVTNPTTWIRTKKSEPIKIENRLPHVKKFIQAGQRMEEERQKPVFTIAILHPRPVQIRQYINENEMIIVDLHKKVYRYTFFATDRLQEGFEKLLDEKINHP